MTSVFHDSAHKFCSVKLSVCTPASSNTINYSVLRFLCVYVHVYVHTHTQADGEDNHIDSFCCFSFVNGSLKVSHLFHLHQTLNSELFFFFFSFFVVSGSLSLWSMEGRGLHGSTVSLTWLEACKRKNKRLKGCFFFFQSACRRDVKPGMPRLVSPFKYLHDLMGQEICGLCAFGIIKKPPVRLYFILLSTYISGGNMFKGMKDDAACKSSHCRLQQFDFQ